MATYRLDVSPHDLLRGSILATIAHAISTIKFPHMAHEQSWDGSNYNVENTMGALGTIAFSNGDAVGAFFDANSPRSPFQEEARYELDQFFEGMPSALRSLANDEALQYLLQDYKGATLPIVTAAFWSEAGQLVAADPWPEVFENGAHLARIQLMDIDEATERWQSEYELTPAQVQLMRSLFDRKSVDMSQPIVLTREEVAALPEGDEAGMADCRDLLAEIGISFPDSND